MRTTRVRRKKEGGDEADGKAGKRKSGAADDNDTNPGPKKKQSLAAFWLGRDEAIGAAIRNHNDWVVQKREAGDVEIARTTELLGKITADLYEDCKVEAGVVRSRCAALRLIMVKSKTARAWRFSLS